MNLSLQVLQELQEETATTKAKRHLESDIPRNRKIGEQLTGSKRRNNPFCLNFPVSL